MGDLQTRSPSTPGLSVGLSDQASGTPGEDSFLTRLIPRLEDRVKACLECTPSFLSVFWTIHECPSFFGKSFSAPLGFTGLFSDSVTAPRTDSQGALASR